MGRWVGLLVAAVAWMLPAPAEPVTGVVVQGDGLPAVGARVCFELEEAPRWCRAVANRSTDEQGRFSLDLPPGFYRTVINDVEQESTQLVSVTAGQPLSLTLGVRWPWSRRPVARASVRVVDAKGQPITLPSVRVSAAGTTEPVPTACQCGGFDDAWPLGGCPMSAPMASPGLVRFTVPAGLVSLRASVGGVETLAAHVASPGGELPEMTLRLPERPRPASELRLTPRPKLVAFVGADGRPLANQWVRVTLVRQVTGSYARTDAQGIADFADCYGKGQQVTFQTPGYQESAPVVFDYAPGQPRLRITLGTRSHAVTGYVRDAAGQPVADCWVVACRPRTGRGYPQRDEVDDCALELDRGLWRYWTANRPVPPAAMAGWMLHGVYAVRSAADGSYRLGDLGEGPWHLVASRVGYQPFEQRAVPLDGRVDLELARSERRIEGHLLEADGQPAARRGIEIEVTGRAEEGQPRWTRDQRGGRFQLATDDQGRFTPADTSLPVGPATVTLTCGCRQLKLDEARLSHAVPTEWEAKLPPLHQLTGRVLLPDGKPAAGAWVGHAESPKLPTAWTDAHGRFTLATTEAGRQTVAAFADGCAVGCVTGSAGDGQPLEIRLLPGERIACQVKRDSDVYLPNGGGVVRAWLADGPLSLSDTWLAVAGQDGESGLMLQCLPRGRMTLSVGGPLNGDDQGEAEVTLPRAEPLVIRTAKKRWARIEGCVRDEHDQPLAGAEVSLGDGEPCVTRADGRFTVDHAWPYGQGLTVAAPGYRSHTEHVQAEPGGRVVLDLRLARQPRCDLAGAPADCQVELALAPPEAEPTTLGLPWGIAPFPVPDGAFRAERAEAGAGPFAVDLDPGRYHAWAALTASEQRGLGTRAFWDLGAVELRGDGEPARLRLPAERGGLRVTLHGEWKRTTDWMPAFGLVETAQRAVVAGFASFATPGTAAWPCLPPGEYRVGALVPGKALPRLPVTVVAGQTATLDLRPCQGVTLSGLVTGAEAPHEVVLRGEGVYGLGSLDHGRYRIDGVPPGQYTLCVGDEARHVEQPVTVAAQPMTIDLKLPPAPTCAIAMPAPAPKAR